MPAWLAFALAVLPSTARADTLEEIQKSGVLIWGADQEGGGPYVYPRDDRPEEVTGFEVEIAARLGEELKVTAQFAQGPWSAMPELLRTGKVHIVLNGYEWSPVWLAAMEATIPYYVYELQLLGRIDDGSLAAFDDLAKPVDGRKRRVGILSGSAAEQYLQKKYGDAVELVSYDGNTDAMREVETGKLDATLQDTPIAAFYSPRFPKLRRVGDPVGRGYYVIYARKGDVALVAALNRALMLMLKTGELERIYRKYGIWDSAQEELTHITETSRFYGYGIEALKAPAGPGAPSAAPGPSGAPASSGTGEEVRPKRASGFEVVQRYGAILLKSAGLTVILSALSFPLAIAFGLMVALGRLYGPSWLKPLLTAYVEFLRGTPVMLQLYFIFFFLPEVGIQVPAFWTGVLGLAINYSAYESEIYRAGLQAIPPGQMEAGLALGMSRRTTLRRIIVPQAVRIVIPAVVNDFIALFKDTSVCSVVTLVELTKRFSVLSQSTQATTELMGLTAVLYLLMSYPLSLASRALEKRLGQQGGAIV